MVYCEACPFIHGVIDNCLSPYILRAGRELHLIPSPVLLARRVRVLGDPVLIIYARGCLSERDHIVSNEVAIFVSPLDLDTWRGTDRGKNITGVNLPSKNCDGALIEEIRTVLGHGGVVWTTDELLIIFPCG